MKAKLGPDHPDTLTSMNNLASSYYALRRHADALRSFEKTLAVRKAKLGPDHPDTLASMKNLARCYDAVGRRGDALKLREGVLALMKANLGPDHPDTLKSMGNLANTLASFDRCSEAVGIIDDCLRRAKGKSVDPRLVPYVLDLRLRVFAKQRDASACRQTAEMWERLERNDADSLYNAACYRAVTAGILPAGTRTPDADEAMRWLDESRRRGVQHTTAHRPHDARPRPRRPPRSRRLSPPNRRTVRPRLSRRPIRTVRPSDRPIAVQPARGQEVQMIHPSRETLDQEIEQQTRLVRGLMAALYARIDIDPDESLLRELAEAKQTLRALQQRRDVSPVAEPPARREHCAYAAF